MPITVEASDSFSNTIRRLQRLQKQSLANILNKYGSLGVSALSSATPRQTGETAASWYYEIEDLGNTYSIVWKNRHVVNGANIALLINYGHGTGTGGYVPPHPYIRQAMYPIIARILLDVRKAVTA